MTLHLSQPLALITHSVRAAKQDIQRGVYRENKQKANKSQKCGDILRRVALEWLETSDIEQRYAHTTAPNVHGSPRPGRCASWFLRRTERS